MLIAAPESLALSRVAVIVSAPPPSVASPWSLTERFTALTAGSSMANDARLSVPPAPPPRPVPEFAFSVPRPMSTVSGVGSSTESDVAASVRVASVAVAPVPGPVKVTVALPLFRFA